MQNQTCITLSDLIITLKQLCRHMALSRLVTAHDRIQEFSSGGGGPGQFHKKSSDDVFLSPQLILQKSNGQFQRNI